MSKHERNLTAIDIGTNSFHMIIVRVDVVTGKFFILDKEKEIVRLGAGSADMKYLSQETMGRAIETLRRFKMLADAAGAPIRAIATSAVREALNQSEFVRRVRAETDIKVEIASGFEEARLIYLGVLQALPIFSKKVLLIDIGGGSTEFLIGKRGNILYDNSLKMGAIRLTQRFFPSGEVNSKSLKACREHIVGMINPIKRAAKKYSFDEVVGSSGTINAIANVIRCVRGEMETPRINNFTFDAKELYETVETIVDAKESRDRAKIQGLDPSRADIIVAGALIIEQIFKEFKLKWLTVSEFALREGIVLDTIRKKYSVKSVDHLEDIRSKSILHLADSLRYEKKHAHHVAALALRIFDQTRSLHGLGPTEREFLEAAAILHEIGFAISHDQHHKHSYYLIRNSELLGFTNNEKEIIGNVARYHRKSHPKLKHEEFAKLSSEDREIVAKLASILRIADGLDRTHAGAVKDVAVHRSARKVMIVPKRTRSIKIDLELWGADRKKALFEETFDVKVNFGRRRSA
jgi:exopolyphosphatase / guanosine-5'-triphosphate,3'-diphosphate pyrophosphatase